MMSSVPGMTSASLDMPGRTEARGSDDREAVSMRTAKSTWRSASSVCITSPRMTLSAAGDPTLQECGKTEGRHKQGSEPSGGAGERMNESRDSRDVRKRVSVSGVREANQDRTHFAPSISGVHLIQRCSQRVTSL